MEEQVTKTKSAQENGEIDTKTSIGRIVDYHNILKTIENEYCKELDDRPLSFSDFIKEDLLRSLIFLFMLLVSVTMAVLDIVGIADDKIWLFLVFFIVLISLGILAVVRTRVLIKREISRQEVHLNNRESDLNKLKEILVGYNLYSKEGIQYLIRIFSDPLEEYSKNTALYSDRLLGVITITVSFILALSSSISKNWTVLIAVMICMCFSSIIYYMIIINIKPHHKNYSRIIADLETIYLYLISRD